MSRNLELKNARNNAIKKAYKILEAETIPGVGKTRVQKYSRDAILAKLAWKFYLATETISNILLMPEDEDNENQLELFPEG